MSDLDAIEKAATEDSVVVLVGICDVGVTISVPGGGMSAMCRVERVGDITRLAFDRDVWERVVACWNRSPKEDRTDVPSLCAELRALRASVAALEKACEAGNAFADDIANELHDRNAHESMCAKTLRYGDEKCDCKMRERSQLLAAYRAAWEASR